MVICANNQMLLPRLTSHGVACSLFLLAFFNIVTAATPDYEPVIKTNFPDPCLAQAADGTWWAFSTQNEGVNVQVASSPDYATWTLHEGVDALPTLPPWTLKHPYADVWAPDVNPLPSGDGWVMYFAARHKDDPKKHCIGTATSPNVTGPYTPASTTLVCDLDRGGNIDPNLFHDPVNGQYGLIYKVDGNSIGHGGACSNTKKPIVPTPIEAILVSPNDLTTPTSQQIFVINNLQDGGFKYDGPNTERPSIAYRNSTYYLMYNVFCYATLEYRVDYISCVSGVDTHSGIYGCDFPTLKAQQEKQSDRTLLKTGDYLGPGNTNKLYAPGSMDTSADSKKMVFHGDTNLAWFNRKPGEKIQRVRAMYASFIDYEGKGEGGNLDIVGLSSAS